MGSINTLTNISERGRIRQAVLPARLHGLRGERSNVPREARYFTERGIKKIII